MLESGSEAWKFEIEMEVVLILVAGVLKFESVTLVVRDWRCRYGSMKSLSESWGEGRSGRGRSIWASSRGAKSTDTADAAEGERMGGDRRKGRERRRGNAGGGFAIKRDSNDPGKGREGKERRRQRQPVC